MKKILVTILMLSAVPALASWTCPMGLNEGSLVVSSAVSHGQIATKFVLNPDVYPFDFTWSESSHAYELPALATQNPGFNKILSMYVRGNKLQLMVTFSHDFVGSGDWSVVCTQE